MAAEIRAEGARLVEQLTMVRSGNSGLNQAQAAQADAAILQRLQLLQAKLDSITAAPPPPAAAAPPPAAAAPPSAELQQLTAMGFPEDQARAALAACNGQLQAAAQWLLDPPEQRRGVPQQQAPAAAAPPQQQQPAAPINARPQQPRKLSNALPNGPHPSCGPSGGAAAASYLPQILQIAEQARAVGSIAIVMSSAW